MNFSFLTPLPPPPPVYTGSLCGGGGGVGGGVKTSLRMLGAVYRFQPGSGANFFLYIDPLTHGGSPWSKLWVPPVAPPPPHGPLLVRTYPFLRWIRLFSDTCKISKIFLFPKSFGSP